MMDKPVSFYAFEMLYWCGIREGELLALTPADFNFDKETVTINKSYQRLKGQDVITSPKTKKSNRTIKMPKFLCEEMKEYLGMIYGLKKKDRIFTVTKSYLHHEMDRGAKAVGVKRIRIHDLRHSHISLLIDMGFSAVAIADRVGHESIDITYQYAHLFPSKQIEMAEKLPEESIKAATKYIAATAKSFSKIPQEERINFILASYNSGIGHVFDLSLIHIFVFTDNAQIGNSRSYCLRNIIIAQKQYFQRKIGRLYQ